MQSLLMVGERREGAEREGTALRGPGVLGGQVGSCTWICILQPESWECVLLSRYHSNMHICCRGNSPCLYHVVAMLMLPTTIKLPLQDSSNTGHRKVGNDPVYCRVCQVNEWTEHVVTS